eukprot:sb/3462263/
MNRISVSSVFRFLILFTFISTLYFWHIILMNQDHGFHFLNTERHVLAPAPVTLPTKESDNVDITKKEIPPRKKFKPPPDDNQVEVLPTAFWDIMSRFEERNKVINDFCELEGYPEFEQSNMYYIPKLDATWIPVFGASSTLWKKFFIDHYANIPVNRPGDHYDLGNLGKFLLHYRKAKKGTGKKTRHFKHEPDDSLRFTVIRHPLYRLIAHFRKPQLDRGELAALKDQWVRPSIILGRNDPSWSGEKRAKFQLELDQWINGQLTQVQSPNNPFLSPPTFSEFVRFIIDADDRGDDRASNGHWLPISEWLDICQNDIDIIVKQENFKSEFPILLEEIDLTDHTQYFLDGATRADVIKIEDYMGQLSLVDQQRINEFYELDYTLFGYQPVFVETGHVVELHTFISTLYFWHIILMNQDHGFHFLNTERHVLAPAPVTLPTKESDNVDITKKELPPRKKFKPPPDDNQVEVLPTAFWDIMSRFEERNKVINDFCELEGYPEFEQSNMYYIPKLDATWIPVFGASSTLWKKFFIDHYANIPVNRPGDHYDLGNLGKFLLHYRKAKKGTGKKTRHFKHEPDDSLRFTVIRHPLYRLIAHFRKPQLDRGELAALKDQWVRPSIILGRNDPSWSGEKRAKFQLELDQWINGQLTQVQSPNNPFLSPPTFSEFVRFIIDADDRGDDRASNGHWLPISEWLDLCQNDIDIIVKQENFKSEFPILLEEIDLTDHTQYFLDGATRADVIKIEDYMGQLSLVDQQRINEFYELDYTLFGYQPVFVETGHVVEL